MKIVQQTIAIITGLSLTTGLSSQPWPAPLEAINQTGSMIEELQPAYGLRAFLVTVNGQSQTFYLTPDERAIIAGIMFDAKTDNVTRAQLERHFIQEPKALTTVDELNKLIIESASFQLGSKHPSLVMFIDPACVHCKKLIQDVSPAIANGSVSVVIIPVGLISERSKWLSASFMASDAPAEAFLAFMLNSNISTDTRINDDAFALIENNNFLFKSYGFGNTPGVFIASMNTGLVLQSDGISPELDQVLKLITE